MSNDKGSFRVICSFCAKMFYPVFPVFPKEVVSKAVGFWVGGLFQFSFDLDPQSWVDKTFKHRILDALSVIDAYFCNLPQAFSACSGLDVDVVSNENHHNKKSLTKLSRS